MMVEVNRVLIVTSENDKFFFLSKRNMNPYLLVYDNNACVFDKGRRYRIFVF